MNEKIDDDKFVDPNSLGGWLTFDANTLLNQSLIASDNKNENIEYNTKLIEIYKSFINEFWNPDLVFYPCCGTDGSASKVFGKVIYLDNSQNVIETMSKNGFSITNWDIKNFVLDKNADLIILMNPQVETKYISKNLKPNGFVICNNYHLTADEFWLDEEFVFLKNLETGEKKFNPVENIKKSKEQIFWKQSTWCFLFQKK